jgi:hypothetical protein
MKMMEEEELLKYNKHQHDSPLAKHVKSLDERHDLLGAAYANQALHNNNKNDILSI